MKSLLHKLLLIGCALHLSGAHWAVLQVGAWTGMLVSRAQTSGVAQAVSTTFDGDHPCGMCKAIAAGQEEAKQAPAEAPLIAMQEVRLVLSESVALPQQARNGDAVWPDFVGTDLRRTETPPVPPPLA